MQPIRYFPTNHSPQSPLCFAIPFSEGACSSSTNSLSLSLKQLITIWTAVRKCTYSLRRCHWDVFKHQDGSSGSKQVAVLAIWLHQVAYIFRRIIASVGTDKYYSQPRLPPMESASIRCTGILLLLTLPINWIIELKSFYLFCFNYEWLINCTWTCNQLYFVSF